MKLDDPTLDSAVREVRENWLLEAVRQQIAYMRATVPFWHERLSKADVNESRIECLADLADVPIFTKAELRATRPAALLPSNTRTELVIGRWTSGTSGQPTVNFWTETDWAALVASTARMLARHAPMQAPTVFNAYSHAHMAGPLYHAALRRLGATVYDRSHHPEEFFSTMEQTKLFDFDTLVIPARSVRGKGVGLADLLDQDPKLLERNRVRWWIGSSGTFDSKTIEQALAQGVQAVSNLYGSSEFAAFAISCSKKSGDYHIAQGHVLVEVVDRIRQAGAKRAVRSYCRHASLRNGRQPPSMRSWRYTDPEVGYRRRSNVDYRAVRMRGSRRPAYEAFGVLRRQTEQVHRVTHLPPNHRFERSAQELRSWVSSSLHSSAPGQPRRSASRTVTRQWCLKSRYAT